MTVDVSSLAIKVTSDGITQASRALSGLGTSAENAEKKVKRLTDAVTDLNLRLSATGALMAYITQLNNLGSTMAHVATNTTNLTLQINQLNSTQLAAAQTHSSATNQLNHANRSGGLFSNTLKSMTVAATAYLGIGLAKGIINAADAWSLMQARLALATGSMNNAKIVQGELFDLAQKIRVPLETATQLYTRMALPMKELGKSSKETVAMVESVSLALQLGGSTAAEASSVMLQFSQSVRAGRLNGAEFNAVSEGAPLILKAIRDELEKTGKQISLGDLKKMGAEGKITFELMQKALANVAPEWRKQFQQLPITVDGAMQRIKNAWLKAMGEMSKESGVSTGLVGFLRVIEDMIPAIRDKMITAFKAIGEWIEKNKEGIKNFWGQIKGLLEDLWKAVGAFVAINAGVSSTISAAEILGFTVFSIRLAIAGIQDGFMLITGIVIQLGTVIYKALSLPFFTVASAVQFVVEGVAKFYDILAKGAAAVGMDDFASSMSGARDSVSGFAEKFEKVKGGIVGVGNDMQDLADASFAFLANGEGAVQTLIKGETELADLVVKRNKMQEEKSNRPPPTVTDPKALAAAKKELEAYERAMTDLTNSLKEQVELSERLKTHGLDYDKLGKGAKAEIAYQSEMNKLEEKKLTNTTHYLHLKKLLTAAQQLDDQEVQNQHTKKALELEEEKQKALETTLQQALDETQKNADLAATVGLHKDAIEAREIARLKDQLAAAGGITMCNAETEALRRLIATKEENKGHLGTIQDGKDAEDAAKRLDKFLDPKRARGFGDAMRDAFGGAGESLNKLVASLQNYTAMQDDIEDARKDNELAKTKDLAKYIKVSEQIITRERINTTTAYASMAGAAKGFFKEHSTGYKVMEAIERGFHLVKLAMMVQSMVADNAATASSVANSGTKAVASTAAGAGKAFEQMGVWGFIGAAAIIAFMASMGISSGGGSSAMTSMQRQEQAGTGSVLGDDSAKSKSISNSMEILESNSNIALTHTSGMLASLRNIEAAMKGVSSIIVRTTGLTKPDEAGMGFSPNSRADKLMGFFNGTFSNKDSISPSNALINKLFGTKKTLTDSGIMAGSQTLDSVLEGGFQGSTFGEIETVKKRLFSKKTSYETVVGALSDEIADQFTKIIQGLAETTKTAVGLLGISSDEFETRLEGFVINFGKISLKGMTGAQVQEQLEAIFSKLGDDIAKKAIPELEAFQRVGEGYFETIVRVSTGVEQASFILEKFGITAIKFTDIVNKQADTGTEIFRQSVMAFETSVTGSLNNVGKIVSVLDGTANDLADVYEQLVATRRLMKNIGIDGETLTAMTIRGAGDLPALNEGMTDYFENFFTAAEQSAQKARNLAEQFDILGIAVPSSMQGFRDLIEGLDTTSEEGQRLFGRLMLLSGAFSEVTTKVEEANKKIEEDRKKGIEDARGVLSTAYDRESGALKSVIDRFKTFGKSLRDFKDSLLIGALSPLTQQQITEQTRMKFQDAASRSLSSDKDIAASGMTDLQSTSTAFLESSQKTTSTLLDYQKEFAKVRIATESAAKNADKQVDKAQEQLNMLNLSVNGILEVNKSVISVREALAKYFDVGGKSTALDVNGQAPSDFNQRALADVAAYGAQYGGDAYYLNENNNFKAKLESATSIAKLTGMTVDEVFQLQGHSRQYWEEVQRQFDAGMHPTTESVVDSWMDGSHANGLPYVPFNGYRAKLHEGEGVLTASENKAFMASKGASGNDIEALVAEIKQLREESNAQQIAIVMNTSTTAKILRKFDTDGIPEERDITA